MVASKFNLPIFEKLGVWILDQGIKEALVEDLIKGLWTRFA
jgi:hypothetical protein